MAVGREYDIVLLRLNDNLLKLYYHTTFEVVNGIRMAAKLAMRHEGMQIPDWRTLAGMEGDRLPSLIPVHPTYRRSGIKSNVKSWDIKWDGSLVKPIFNELVSTLHFSDAFRLQIELRNEARDAKAWSGDKSKALRVTAYLSDAEDDYKHGYAT